MGERYLKQVCIAPRDLHMPTGKLGAMVGHAAMTFILSRLKPMTVDGKHGFFFDCSPDEARWLTELDPGFEYCNQVSMAKIVCSVADGAELVAVEQRAKDEGLVVHRVVDSGYSHNKPGALACLAVGPDWPERLAPVTGSLKVYR